MHKLLRQMKRAAAWRRWISHPAPPADGAPAVGEVDFGDLRRLSPFDSYYGLNRDRAWVIDRYYIENFLESHQSDIRGRVLEIDSDMYTRRFGGRQVDRAEVLFPVPGHPKATIIADLGAGDSIPSDSFDCFICTQTLLFIYDLRAAVQTIHRILKPGGVLLLTVPGISRLDSGSDGEQFEEYWHFTRASVRRLLTEAFQPEDVTVTAHGNVLVAAAYLFGLGARDLRREEIEYHDPTYQLTITARAVKARAPGPS